MFFCVFSKNLLKIALKAIFVAKFFWGVRNLDLKFDTFNSFFENIGLNISTMFLHHAVVISEPSNWKFGI